MKKALFICIIAVVLQPLLAQAFRRVEPKLFTYIYDRNSDSNEFEFIPSPATCELHLVTSNSLVWVDRREERRAFRRPPVFNSVVYVQKELGQTPTRIIRFGGHKTPSVVGVSSNGSLLFASGEEFIVSGDVSARLSSDSSAFFHADIRDTCPFDVHAVTSPSMFARRLSEDRTPVFTLPVFRKGSKKTMKEIRVRAIPGDTPFWRHMKKTGALPSPESLRHIWPVVRWDDTGLTIWNGDEWTQFKWDANK